MRKVYNVAGGYLVAREGLGLAIKMDGPSMHRLQLTRQSTVMGHRTAFMTGIGEHMLLDLPSDA
jgi:hypothetical protein